MVAKITDDGSAFTQEEIYSDFERLYRKYVIINKNLGDFFKRETKDILNQLCDDFEVELKNLKSPYPEYDMAPIAAEPPEEKIGSSQ